MAGSRVIRQYTDDAGNNYAIRLDESNAEGVTSGGNVLMPPRQGNVEGLPRGLEPRYVLTFLQSNPDVKRKFKVGGVTQVNDLFAVGATISAAITSDPTDNSPGTEGVFVVTAYRGEKRNFIPAIGGNTDDTGLTDGDPG